MIIMWELNYSDVFGRKSSEGVSSCAKFIVFIFTCINKGMLKFRV